LKSLKAAKIVGQLSLQSQGLLFLGFFFFFQTIFFGASFWLVQSAEDESRREEHYKKILEKTQGLIHPAVEGMGFLKQYARNKNPQRLEAYNNRTAEVFENLEWIKKQLASDPESTTMINDVGDKLKKLMKVLDQARKESEAIADPDQAEHQFAKRQDDLQADWMAMIMEMKDLLIKERRFVSDSPEEQRRYRRLSRTVLVAGYGVNFIFAVILFKFLFQMITSRLKIMVDDTQKFKSGKELNPLLAGRDEIAELNGAFHSMAAEVREAQRMRQTFVAMISHDLRTPLTSVQGYLELVSIGAMGEVSEQTRKGAEMAEQNTGRLIRLISDLLDLEKMEAGKMQMSPKVIYLESVIEKSVQAIAEFANNHEVSIDFGETDAEVNADPDRLIQVIVNLASNAVKFSPKGETVQIKVIEEGESVEVQVIDRGRGVPAEYREAIFEKYKQVKSTDATKKGGTGLGLPICKLIVEQSGGSIGVRSEEKQGSTFWFKLPRVTTAPEPGSAGGSPATKGS
jgi:signal transduction histidine kinase